MGAILVLANSSSLNQTLAYFGSTAGIALVSGLADFGGAAGLNATGQASLSAMPTKLNQSYEVLRESSMTQSWLVMLESCLLISIMLGL